MHAGPLTGVVKSAKTSGEPTTKENNGIVAKCMSNYVFNHRGPMVAVYKGDDFFVIGSSGMNEGTLTRILSACDLKLRIKIGQDAEVCGFISTIGALHPSSLHRLDKVFPHRFYEITHWHEYQASIRKFF